MNLLQIKEAIAANKKDCPGFGNMDVFPLHYFLNPNPVYFIEPNPLRCSGAETALIEYISRYSWISYVIHADMDDDTIDLSPQKRQNMKEYLLEIGKVIVVLERLLKEAFGVKKASDIYLQIKIWINDCLIRRKKIKDGSWSDQDEDKLVQGMAADKILRKYMHIDD